MTRPDCVSNRNIKIIATYTRSRIGDWGPLFHGLPYPTKEYSSPAEFFLDEDEWTTYENFERIFRKAKELVDEPHFYFNCGASCGTMGSWGRLNYFVRIFSSPQDGFHRLPFFNKTFNDTKEIRIVRPAFYDPDIQKIRLVLQVRFHEDFDPNRDYIGDPFLRGIISSIPTLWNLSPATIKQPLNPYDPVRLFNHEPEFMPYELDAKMEDGRLTVRDPISGERIVAGKEVLLLPERINGQSVYLGRYVEPDQATPSRMPDEATAILITRTISTRTRILLKEGEIFSAPYFILDVSFERFSLFKRLVQAFRVRRSPEETDKILIESIDRLRENMEAKHEAYRALEKTNEELKQAKEELRNYATYLEQRVEQRTAELARARAELLELTNSLKNKMNQQVQELERHKELRRYLSPKLAERILTEGGSFAQTLQRKFMTVVFSDIRGFSAITDSLEPEEIVYLLNSYHSEMIKIIHKYDGTLNKIMGDGLVIFFGDPIHMNDHADRAVRMAMDMQIKVQELKKQWRAFGHDLGVGIGINTGYMTVGNIGSEALRDYTVIGNQVNIAARLEQMAKPDQILITQRTLAHLTKQIPAQLIGEIEVKGIHTPIKVYTVSNF
ncbi:MAG: hypothetical protein JRH08_15385 [Deltaproteobacteria bacterium]|nr:hypothetical protein [Deltaproteobacteria bacterium]MBW1928927.1 hypothetical protein [Deltaproteobacteria bacterium]MBW2026450.1 hypothetical protein [Deltaproteobacteria bacterium]MBW2127013.1 hypothetical protein [Deltaproteobacteria bacterium]